MLLTNSNKLIINIDKIILFKYNFEKGMRLILIIYIYVDNIN